MAQFDSCPKCKSGMIAPAGSVWICFSCNHQFGGDSCSLSTILSDEESKNEIVEIIADDAEDDSYGVVKSAKPETASSTKESSSAPSAERKIEPSEPIIPLRQPDGLITVDGEDDNRESDDEYRSVFNATVMAIAEMPFDTEEERVDSLSKIQARIHELDAIIRKAKIQQQGLRAAKEHRLQFVSSKSRAKLSDEDKNYKPKPRKLDANGQPKELKPKKPTKAEKSAEAFLGLSGLSAKVMKAANVLMGLGLNRDQIIAKLRESGLLS